MSTPPSSPSLPWKTRAVLYVLSSVTDASCRRDGTVNRRIFSLVESFRIKTPPNPNPKNGVKTSDVTIDASRNLWCRIFTPVEHSDDQLPVIVFFHGGGFVYLAPDYGAYDAVCRRFARTIPAVVVSVNYRLAPEHRYPAQYDDGFDVLRFLEVRKEDLLPPNADVSKCFLAGDSAGGNLSHHVAKRSCQSDFSKVKVIGVVSIQPFFGGEERTQSEVDLEGVDLLVSRERTDWMWKAFIPPDSDMDRDHEVINVSGPNAQDLSKLDYFPATLVVIGGFDSLKDWQMRYYQWLKKSGKEAYLVEYPTMIHAFYIFPQLPESGMLVDEVKQFVKKIMGSKEGGQQ